MILSRLFPLGSSMRLLIALCQGWAITAFVSNKQHRDASILLGKCSSLRRATISMSKYDTDAPVADEIEGWRSEFETEFLEKYWQKKPVLIRKCIPNLAKYLDSCLTKEDMFALSYDDDVESRLIQRKGQKWNKDYGPFDEDITDDLPEKEWTILVQEVDRHIPQIADLWKSHFDFIPSWRRDDVMISYAADGGGIGGHVDSYDVFLLQGRGQREWAIENSFVSAEEELAREVPNADTRLLKDFRCDQAWILQPGDVLYLPPRVPHRGVSLGGGCTTISMGYRSPTYRSMVTALGDYICQNKIPEKLLYSDPDLRLQASSGVIEEKARRVLKDTLKQQILSVLDNNDEFDDWLGRYLTLPLRMQLRKPRAFFLPTEERKRSLRAALREVLTKYAVATPSSSLNNGSGSKFDYSAEDVDEGFDFDDDDDDDGDDDLPIYVRGRSSVALKDKFSSAKEVLEKAYAGELKLRRAEGVKYAYFELSLFVDGESYPITPETIPIATVLCDNRVIDGDMLINNTGARENALAEEILLVFIQCGYLYPVGRS